MFVCGSCGKRYDRGGFCPEDGQPLGETADPLLGTEIGRYRLARQIGEGGMGQVYLAVQPAIGSRVAIKILSDQCARNPELLERFFSEAKAVNLIRHEHIVSVTDLAQLPDGRPYIVMEFIEGNTLAAIVRSRHAPIGGVVQVMGEVLSALGAAHQLGIVHRDLKPDNILITGEGHAKVLDFGIAKLAPGLSNALSPRTRTGALLGTPAYMAPEQISGSANVDSRTDLYAAGIVLYEAVTGQVPFAGETLYDLMRAHLETAPPDPRGLRADLPPALANVILQALAKDPNARFQTAQAMAQAMTHAASTLPPEAWRPLSSRGAVIAGRPSMEQALQRTPPEISKLPTQVATPIPGPHDPTLATRRTGTWIALAAVLAVVGGAVIVALSSRGSAADKAEPALVASEGGSAAPSQAPIASPPSPSPVEASPAVTSQAPDPTPATPTPASPKRGITPAASPTGSAGGGGGGATTSPPPGQPTIVGGGSAADHGVHIGPGVTVGSNVVIGGNPPAPAGKKFTRPIDYDPRKFDAAAYAPKALALARSIFPDAGFVRLDMNYVFPNGLADLTKSDSDSSYVFRSPSHSARPTDVPRNVEVEIECYVEVTVGAREVEVRARDMSPIDSNCKWPLRPLPKCSLAKVWAKAQADGAKPDTVAKIGFLSDGQWFFDNEFDDEGIVKSYPDACP